MRLKNKIIPVLVATSLLITPMNSFASIPKNNLHKRAAQIETIIKEQSESRFEANFYKLDSFSFKNWDDFSKKGEAVAIAIGRLMKSATNDNERMVALLAISAVISKTQKIEDLPENAFLNYFALGISTVDQKQQDLLSGALIFLSLSPAVRKDFIYEKTLICMFLESADVKTKYEESLEEKFNKIPDLKLRQLYNNLIYSWNGATNILDVFENICNILKN